MKAKFTTEKRIVVKPNKTEHVLNWDLDNAYPQNMIDVLNDSVTAMTCYRIMRKFVIGGGFIDPTFYKSAINRDGDTPDKLLRKILPDVCIFQSIALHVNFNALTQSVEVYRIPIENCRMGSDEEPEYDGKIAIYSDWAKCRKKNIRKEDVKWYNRYNPSQVLNEVAELTEYDKDGNLIVDGWDVYEGQILWLTPNGEYPLAIFDVSKENAEAEGDFKRFNRSNVKNNFEASHILGVDEFELDEDGNSPDREVFEENLTEFQGAEGNGILIVEKKNPEDKLELIKVERQDYDGAWEKTEISAEKSIRKSFLVPPALFLDTASGFSNDEIINAIQLYNELTSDERLIIEEAFKLIFDNWYKVINPSRDYSIIEKKAVKVIPPEYSKYVTTNEYRASLGLPDAVDQEAEVKMLADTLGVGGTQALTSILIDTTLEPLTKRATLKLLFNFTDDQVKELVPIIETRP